MKYTLEEIEKMLVYSRPHKDLEGNILYLSSAMKEIVSELVNEVIDGAMKFDDQVIVNGRLKLENGSLIEENKKLREALERINQLAKSLHQSLLEKQ